MTTSQTKIFLVCFCLLLLYLSWGSVYFVNKILLEYYPPLSINSYRFILAGLIMLAFTYVRKEKSRITWIHIKHSAVISFFMILVGSGALYTGQQLGVPSGVCSVLYATVPLVFLLSDWLFWGGDKPSKYQMIGLVLGLGAMAVLNMHQLVFIKTSAFGVFFVILSVIGWVFGSHMSKVYHVGDSLSVPRSTGLMLLLGGIESLFLALFMGERVNFASLPIEAYLWCIFGVMSSSIIAYSAYLWLLYNTRAAVAVSYEYVIPIVAIPLGVVFAGESVDSIMIAASLVLVLSVCLIVTHSKS